MVHTNKIHVEIGQNKGAIPGGEWGKEIVTVECAMQDCSQNHVYIEI